MAVGKGEAAIAPELTELLGAIDRFCRRPRPGDPADELVHLRHACDLLELEFAAAAAAFAASDEYDRQGSVTPIDWIRHHCNMSGHAAADRVCVGQQLPNLPQSTEALAAGEIGFAHLSLMASTARALTESATARPFDEADRPRARGPGLLAA